MRRAFTLIELSIVIATVAILAGILFPVFAQAKLAAKKTAAPAAAKQRLDGLARPDGRVMVVDALIDPFAD